MVLHARVVMDLREKLEREICFEQVEGDFYSFKGKWRLEQLGDQHTLLKYMVETKMHKDTFLSESILEEVCATLFCCDTCYCYEVEKLDRKRNLCAPIF
jgi:ribosome-associated toxin RatA of RatAB toxin-antitoxin module